MKKLIAGFFILLIAVTTLVSCTKVIDNSNFKTEGYLLVDGEEVVPEYVMKIGDSSISFAEYRYYYLNEKFELDGGDETIWEDYPEYIDTLEKYTRETLVEVYSIRSLAKENGVEPNVKQVSEEIKGFKEGLTSEQFNEGLATYHLTENLYEYILQGYELYKSLFDYYFGENGVKAMTNEEMKSYLEENYIHAKHILIYPNTTMSDEEYLNLLNTVEDKAQNTDDFDALIKEYSDDADMPEYGYYFTAEEMPKEFVEACNSLAEGEISGLVRTSHGYHVIQKLPVDDGDIDVLKDVVYNGIYNEIIEERISSINVEYAPEYEHISPYTVK